ncbi:hypothetical protein L1987_22859 [Smallanthus sonchifolius]|uniref:Uncharacterized protein n=1 Tax=Smallanthus sonchifolius TaxID=185202 RepID=A0ACB9IHH3_9ASTR|nr:hypothetical protein L1987_22859 [Smallanthus sonchifolius]
MKSKRLAFIFILLCAQFISSLALESKEEKGPVDMNENSHGREDGVKQDELVLSKASKGKGAYGGQNDRPPNTNKSNSVSTLLHKPTYISSVGVSVIITNIILAFCF